MNTKLLATIFLSVSMIACAQKTPTVKQKKKEANKSTVQKTKFANAIDPICNMKTEDDMKDTALYKGKTYGFCSSYCKDEFNKNPEKYVQK